MKNYIYACVIYIVIIIVIMITLQCNYNRLPLSCNRSILLKGSNIYIPVAVLVHVHGL